MSTYYSLRVHIIFSTKHRAATLDPAWLSRLHAYLGGCARTLEVVPEAIGGVEDHVHLLLGLKTKHSVADVVREVKKASTSWIQTEIGLQSFAWQEGYAAIAVSPRDRDMLVHYVATQEEHHRKVSGIDELISILEEAGLTYDPAYLR